MSAIKKTVKTRDVSFNCKTLGDLLDYFEVKLSFFMNDKKRSFNLCSGTSGIFNEYLILDYYENPLHVFKGKNGNSNIEYVLDIIHQRIYRFIHDKGDLLINEYDLDGKFINRSISEDIFSIEEIVEKHLKRDYFCYDVGELLSAFNLDFELSDKLKKHVLIERKGQKCDYCCGHRIGFSDYQIKEINGRTLYVFESMFDNNTIVFDLEPPVYYINPERQFLYVETKGMVGICILQFNKNNEIVKDAHSWVVDMEMFLQLTD